MTDQSVTLPAERPPSDIVAVLEMIERVASNPDAVASMPSMMAIRREIRAEQARIAYFTAMARMQSKLPIIAERGRLMIRERETKKILQVTPFARWEDINEAILPVLGEHGFALWFRTGTAADGKLTVTGILSHAEGHAEETTLALPLDQTGSKNAVQAIGSTTSYGKRYAAAALLNLTSRAEEDQDTDAASGGDLPIAPQQVEQIQTLIVQCGADIQKVLDYARKGDPSVVRIDDIKQHDFERMISALKQKKRMTT